jgi:hypothetical protein
VIRHVANGSGGLAISVPMMFLVAIVEERRRTVIGCSRPQYLQDIQTCLSRRRILVGQTSGA